MKVVDFALGDATKGAKGWTVAVVSEGYTQAELEARLFDSDVAKFVSRLSATPPFSHPDLQPLLNVVMVRKASQRTGNTFKLLDLAHPSPPSGTAWGVVFGGETSQGQQVKRSVYGNFDAVKKFVRSQPGLESVNHFLVLINNTELYAGQAKPGEAGWFTKSGRDWPDVAIHELAHQAFGFADEYEYTHGASDPVSSYAGVEPDAPNVTTVTDVRTIKWSNLLTLTQAEVPTTVRSTPCVRDHPLVETDPPIPANAVGAYEGANHADCGIFRPSLTCRMRHSTHPFCRVCETRARADIGHYLLAAGQGFLTPAAAGAWTHMQSFTASTNQPRMLAYNVVNGAYAISNTIGYATTLNRRPDGSPALVASNPSLGTGSIGADWTCLVPFTLDGNLHYFGHQFGSGTQGIFAMNATATALTPTHTTPPGHARPPSSTHIVTLNLGGAPHYIGYNGFTGDAALFRIDSATADPVPVSTMQWGPGHTAVVTLTLDGEPFVLTYKMSTGEVLIRRLTPPGFTMTFASPSDFWRRNITHVALMELSGRPYLARYSGLDGRASIHHVRLAGAGVDNVCAVPPPGRGGLSLFGVGAPAMGRTSFSATGGSSGADLYFYNAQFQTLNMMPLILGSSD
ncbi:M64 family metallopeptidase [Streptomyces sp. NPDC056159]|uniref:M64 family metallopeptidase n=1 Tax=Streptomyces sp. NPDC056159 TaxID=3155537 RepID=UPI00342B82E7